MGTTAERQETFTLDEFCTGAWRDRVEYDCQDIGFSHIESLHREMPNYSGCFMHGEHAAAFLHDSGLGFSVWLYLVGDRNQDNKPIDAEPFMWVYGTTFDGVRECSGGQCFNGDLREMADVLRWLHEFLSDRWPRFKAWYDDIDLDRRLG